MPETVEDPRVLDTIRSYGQATGTELFRQIIIGMYLGQHIEFGELMPSDTEWCID